MHACVHALPNLFMYASQHERVNSIRHFGVELGKEMWHKILGDQPPRRLVFSEALRRIVYPLNRMILKVSCLRKVNLCLYVRGFFFFFRPFVLSDWVVLFSDWEPYVKSVFNPDQGQVVFDVGAHIGLYTLIAARKVGKNGMVVAFEPDTENFRLLSRNVQINKFTNVRLFRVALGREDSEKVLYMGVNPVHSSLLPPYYLRARKKVRVATLDRIMEKLQLTRIDWIKIDVEGAEMDVLEGGKKTIGESVHRIIIETSNENVLKFLVKRKFRIDKLFDMYIPYYFACMHEKE